MDRSFRAKGSRTQRTCLFLKMVKNMFLYRFELKPSLELVGIYCEQDLILDFTSDDLAEYI